MILVISPDSEVLSFLDGDVFYKLKKERKGDGYVGEGNKGIAIKAASQD